MGVAPDQLPPYIYTMRVLGYPPGHLENARIQSSASGMSMFDEHGRGNDLLLGSSDSDLTFIL